LIDFEMLGVHRYPAVINLLPLQTSIRTFKQEKPFPFVIIDQFLETSLAAELEADFLPYDSPKWFVYKNQIEDKKALNDWNVFPPTTYCFFSYLNSPEFVTILSSLVDTQLYVDQGLHGGGWHVHGPGGNLNPHLDYSIHPKLKLQRKLNLIIYISNALREEHGGHLGLYAHDAKSQQPGKCEHEIAPRYNRAVLFDTTQHSWHGMSRGLSQPEGIYRKSLAIYYLCQPVADADQRDRALFAPRESQFGNQAVEELIRSRSRAATSEQVYRT
jgi:hypothetical protein